MIPTNKFGRLEPTQKLIDVVNGAAEKKGNTERNESNQQQPENTAKNSREIIQAQLTFNFEWAYNGTDTNTKS